MLKFIWNRGQLGVEINIPPWLVKLLRMRADPRAIAHGKASRNWRDRRGFIEVNRTDYLER